MKELINKIKDKTQIVRRYMDYPKFLSLLTTESIYFAKPSEFKDPLDGLCPKFTGIENSPEIKHMELEHSKKLAKQIVENVHVSLKLLSFGNSPNEYQTRQSFENFIMAEILDKKYVTAEMYLKSKNEVKKVIDEYIDGNVEYAINNLAEILLKSNKEREVTIQDMTKRRALISCWQMCNEESDLMWQCYTNSSGIMIQTTVEKLESLNYTPFLANDASCIIDKVIYDINLSEYHEKCNSMTIKDNRDELNKDFLENYFIKSKSLSDEKELRILIAEDLSISKDIYNSSTGMNIKININLEDFIDRIVISPYAPNYYIDTLKCTMEKFGLKKLVSKIAQSAIKIEQESLLK